MNFMETIWSLVVVFLYLSYLVVLFQIVGDLFRDSRLNGWLKALWILLLIILPVLTALVYLVVRGRGMALRQQIRTEAAVSSTEDYLRTLASAPEPAKQIADAKALLDSGTITSEEFAVLKAKALA
ncbi:MAG: SHOCT domain-containing protein [Micrococcaceae bacterium]|nr:SHOCT domain-containing protein [Micrococcaceae bacterium]